ncbi:MAG: tRNA lysidine(34) synthetase TilS [Alphaproteobacteria bacterium]|nr:tRNA lysidine(34) synthetase TilS [Alphaproteobacteria bacterium]
MNKNFNDLLKSYKNRRIAVAVSGGIDSMALMHIAANSGLNAVAVTVDHGLRENSASDAKFVEQIAAKIKIPHYILHWTGTKPKTGIEDAARRARYELLLDFCRAHDIKVLMTAHQADDQIETFLMNLGRGSGVYGLAGIRAELTLDGITIARPLLDVTRAELIKYCKNNKIEYVHDEMNDDENFTRVKIRKNRHILEDRLGITDARILTAIHSLGRVRDMLEDDVEELVSSVLINNRAIFSEKFLTDMPHELRMKFLSRILQKIGTLPYPPRLEKIERAIICLENDCKFTTARCIVRRVQSNILIAAEGQSCSFRKAK